LGILPGHMPVTVLLKPGALRYHTELGEAHFYVSGGTLQAKENEVMVLADIIERADSIDIVAAEKAMSDAKKLLAGKLDEAEHHKHQLEWVEALAKLRVARLQSGR
jgi:F-type H+-transporting ATPase subunit epsilon